MKLNSVLPLVVAAALSAPANSAMAGGPQIRNNGIDRVHFNPENGRLKLRRPDKLSPVESEEALVEVLYYFRGLVYGCLAGGTLGDTKIGPYEEEFTVNCGEEVAVTTCTFGEGRDAWNSKTRADNELRITCTYPGGDAVILGHAMRKRIRYIEPAESTAERLRPDSCTAPAGCTEEVMQFETELRGTNAGKKCPAGRRRSKLTLLHTIAQRSDGTMKVSAGPDDFGAKRKHYIEPFRALSQVFIDMKEKFHEKVRSKKSSPRRKAEGRLAGNLRER